jgi:hypothetical protein
MLALVAAFAYIRLDHFKDQEQLARQLLFYLGEIALLVMSTFCIFVISHLGSKIRRWKEIEWEKMPLWQELWACFSMWLFASVFWIVSVT